MKRLIIALICSIFALSFLSPLVAAYAGDWEQTDYAPTSWDSLSSTQKYYAYYAATKNVEYQNNSPTDIISFNDYNTDPQKRQAVNRIGSKYITWNNEDGFYVRRSRQNDYNETVVGLYVNECEENGLANYNQGNFNGPANTAQDSQAETAREEFFSSKSTSNPSTFDFGNGYKIIVSEVTDDTYSPVNYDTYQDTIYNGSSISNVKKHSTSGFRGTSNVYAYEFWISRIDNNGTYSYMMNFTYYYTDMLGVNRSVDGAYSLDSNLIEFVPTGMNSNQVIPQIVKPINPINPYTPVSGSDQSGVNEELQKQNNDILIWLEKIYNAELDINGSIGSLLNPLYNLTNLTSNLYEVCTAILNKLDNLTVKLKDWRGNEFKIELGDLELGDIAIDFDVVYNITGITKITTVNDVFKDMNNHKAAIESKLGVGNVKTSVNNFTTSLFGQAIFGQNGSVTSGTISESATVPHLYFTFLGSTYDLFAGLAYFDSNDITTWKQIVTFFLYASTALCVFRSLPVLIGGVAGIENRASMVEHVQMEDNFALHMMNPHTGQLPDRITMYGNGFKGRWM